MEIVWFIGFWNYNVSFAIDLSSLMIERKKFTRIQHDKINIGFQTGETRLFVFYLWFFLLMFCFRDECF
jgi:hypothetical protein